MTDRTETQMLADRFDAMAKEGLLDVKFYVSGEASTEQFCREVNRLYKAVENKEAAPLDFKDSYGKPPK